jgi:ubiquinone/menaquinone biosynthesis C-methylase UbiE
MSEPNRDAVTYWNWEAPFWDAYVAGFAPEGEIQFFVEEAQQSGSPILEIGCGTGRTLIPVAESGMTIVGLDLSAAMLSKAREKISRLDMATQGRIELVEGDMRSFTLGRRFTLVTVTYAFFFLTTPEDQRRALRCIREHLLDNGRLIFINPDPKLDVIAAHLGPLGTALKKFDEFADPDSGHPVVIWHRREYDLERQLSKTDYLYEEMDADGRVIGKTYKTLTARFTYRYEMQYLLELCGYRIEALHGDFKRGPFQPGGFQIWVARKD